MSLRLYDTLRREVRTLEPVSPGRVSVYVCGPTVQAEPHIGHLRSGIAFDILRRWLLASGLEVTFARNVTDIDDKIIHDAGHHGVPWWELAERMTRAFSAAYDAVNVLPPTIEPRATAHIPQMVELIEALIAKGHAYVSGGDVYMDVRSLPTYGELSRQDPDNLQVTEKTEELRPKRDALDFALWKGAKPGEPSWTTPWGLGRPGWHIECSAMAATYLGEAFDVHGGGLDLVFPHHENELAQSQAAGHPFARHWMHHGLVNIGAEKMSKSLGNSLLVRDLLAQVRPVVLRYALGSAHYRSRIDWSAGSLAEAEAAWSRVETFVRNAGLPVGTDFTEAAGVGQRHLLPAAFVRAMDDDLSVPQALAVLHSEVREGNAALAAGDVIGAQAGAARVTAMAGVLGLQLGSVGGAAGLGSDRDGAGWERVVDALVTVALAARQDARERKDYAAADRIRDEIVAAGVLVEDTAAGPRWRLAEGD